jgi:hypothetical protein
MFSIWKVDFLHEFNRSFQRLLKRFPRTGSTSAYYRTYILEEMLEYGSFTLCILKQM